MFFMGRLVLQTTVTLTCGSREVPETKLSYPLVDDRLGLISLGSQIHCDMLPEGWELMFATETHLLLSDIWRDALFNSIQKSSEWDLVINLPSN